MGAKVQARLLPEPRARLGMWLPVAVLRENRLRVTLLLSLKQFVAAILAVSLLSRTPTYLGGAFQIIIAQ